MEEINKEFQEAIDKVNQVKDIFVEFFGEDKVDLRELGSETNFREGNFRPFILVYWPLVIVSNEHDESVEIQDLYAKMVLDKEGALVSRFKLNRSTYTYSQFISNYMHSHVCDIPKSDYTRFQSPCLGDGPIQHTCLLLNSASDLDIWRLFCLELDKYIHNESISGGPYHRLSSIGNIEESFNPVNDIIFRRPEYPEIGEYFAPKLLEDHTLRIVYKDGVYCIGLTSNDIIITLSNALINYCNTIPELQSKNWIYWNNTKNLFRKGTLKNGLLYYVRDNGSGEIEVLENDKPVVLTFKDQEIHLKLIKGIETTNDNYLNLLRSEVIESIVYYVVAAINAQSLQENGEQYKSIGGEDYNTPNSSERRIIFL